MTAQILPRMATRRMAVGNYHCRLSGHLLTVRELPFTWLFITISGLIVMLGFHGMATALIITHPALTRSSITMRTSSSLVQSMRGVEPSGLISLVTCFGRGPRGRGLSLRTVFSAFLSCSSQLTEARWLTPSRSVNPAAIEWDLDAKS